MINSFMNFLLSFLLNNKSLSVIILLGAIIAGQGVYIYVEKQRVIAALAEKEAAETKLAVCEQSVEGLRGAINRQNEAIEKLKADAEKREKENKVALDKAKAKADNYKKQAEELMGRVPPQNISKCDAANRLINEEVSRGK